MELTVNKPKKKKKKKKSPSRKKFLILKEIELSGSNIKKIQETEKLKKLLTFREMELFSTRSKKFLRFHETKTPKKCLIFSEKKVFLIFRETESLKKFLIFHKTELSNISGSNFTSSKSKKNPLLKNLFCFRRLLAKPENQKSFIILLSRSKIF